MSKYPEDWKIANLGDLVAIKASSVDKKSKEGQEEVLLCNYMDVFKNSVVSRALDFMRSTASKREIWEFSLSKGDVLLTKDSEVPEEIGIPSLVTEDIPNLVCGYHLYILRACQVRIDSGYLCWALRSNSSRQYFYQMANGSTRFGLNLKHVEECPIAIPPLPEQKKIAQILASIDAQIERNKRKQVSIKRSRNAFLEEYFSCGWKRFEEESASSWSLHELIDLLEDRKLSIRSGPFGSALLKSELSDSGFPFLGIDNVQTEEFVRKYKRYVGEKKFLELQKYEVFPGDVMITIMGTVGRCCVVPDIGERCLSSKHTWVMTFRKDIVSPEIICWQLNYFSRTRKHFMENGQGGVMDSISSSTIKTTKIPLPNDTEELKEVSNFYNSSLLLEQKLSAKILKLQHLRKGVSADLLSGRKRVSV